MTSADRDRHNADPRQRGSRRRSWTRATLPGSSTRSPADRSPPLAGGPGDTVALVAADACGLGVALVQSLYDGFGSGILEPATGIVLHSRGSAFSLDPEHPNVTRRRQAPRPHPAAGRRPPRRAPGRARRDDGRRRASRRSTPCRWCAASTSAWTRPPRSPRRDGSSAGWRSASRTAPWWPSRACPDDAGRPRGRGLHDRDVGDEDGAVGHAHLLLMREDGTLEAGSDPRADGAAAAR